jgi:hypothetical protein
MTGLLVLFNWDSLLAIDSIITVVNGLLVLFNWDSLLAIDSIITVVNASAKYSKQVLKKYIRNV